MDMPAGAKGHIPGRKLSAHHFIHQSFFLSFRRQLARELCVCVCDCVLLHLLVATVDFSGICGLLLTPLPLLLSCQTFRGVIHHTEDCCDIPPSISGENASLFTRMRLT